MLKLLAIIIVLFFVYLLFFKKSREQNIQNTKDDNEILEDMVECPTCHTFVSKDEAILSNGRYYCSKECLPK